MTPWAAYRWLAQLGSKRAGAGENVEANERQVNGNPWGMANWPVFRRGVWRPCAPPFRPDFLGAAVAPHRALGQLQRSPLTAIP